MNGKYAYDYEIPNTHGKIRQQQKFGEDNNFDKQEKLQKKWMKAIGSIQTMYVKRNDDTSWQNHFCQANRYVLNTARVSAFLP